MTAESLCYEVSYMLATDQENLSHPSLPDLFPSRVSLFREVTMVQDQDVFAFPKGCMDVKDCFENLLKCGCHTVWIIGKGLRVISHSICYRSY